MTRRGLWSLALLAAVLVAVAAYVSSTRRTERAAGVGELLYPGLEASLDQVTAVRVLGPGGTPVVTLKRADTGWQVAERSGYPADASHVRTLLLGLAQARVLEEKTSLPTNYPSLGVEDLGGTGATGTGVELEGPPQPVSLIVGKSSGANSSFVRRKGEAASWKIGKSVAVERDPAKWLATGLLDIGADRVQSAEFVTAGRRPWTAVKSSRADLGFTVKDKPAKGSSESTNVDKIASSLAALRLTDVRRASDVADAKPAATATYRTFDGLVLALEGYTEGDKRYVRVKPSLDVTAARRFFVAPATAKDPASAPGEKDAAARSGAAPAPAAANEQPAAAASEPKSDAAKAAGTPAPASTPETVLAQTRAEAEKLEARLSGWMFEIPSWSYDAIFVQP